MRQKSPLLIAIIIALCSCRASTTVMNAKMDAKYGSNPAFHKVKVLVIPRNIAKFRYVDTIFHIGDTLPGLSYKEKTVITLE